MGTVALVPDAAAAQAFLARDGLVELVYTQPGARRTQFNSINDKGQIVGRWTEDATGRVRGLLYVDGMASVYDLPDAINTHLFGINDLGQIVGYYTSSAFAGTRGFLLENALDGDPLNDLVTEIALPLTNASGTRAYSINSDGDVVGTFDGFSRAFVSDEALLVPAPGSAALMLLAPALLAWRAHRQLRPRGPSS